MKHHLKMAMIFVVLFPIGCKDAAIDSPIIPRPSPKADFDAIASRVIRNHAEKLARNPEDALVWKRYGNVCLINGWPDEAMVAYEQAEALGDSESIMMRAHGLREMDDSGAFSMAEKYFQLTQDQECAESIAIWHYEDGSLAKARSWLDKSKNPSVRGSSLSILIEIQLGNFDAAKEQTKQLLERSNQPSVKAVAAAVGQATQDEELLSEFGEGGEKDLIPVAPRLGKLQPLARTELADVRRAIRLRANFQAEEALKRVAPILKQRPSHAFIQSMGADLERQTGMLKEAKSRLDRVRADDNSDYEFWLIDAAVHSEIHQSDRSRANELVQAEASIQKALLLNPDIAEGHQLRAVIYEQQGNVLKAGEHFRIASNITPKLKERVRLISESLRCMAVAGEVDRALDELDQLSSQYGNEYPEPRIESAIIAANAGKQSLFFRIFDGLDTESKNQVGKRVRDFPQREK